MRSRYTAYSQANIGYIVKTMRGEAANGFNAAKSQAWASQASWNGLTVKATKQGNVDDDTGWVEFIARYEDNNGKHFIYEHSEFKKIDGHWYYAAGEYLNDKVSRNDTCPCGSELKFKKCCK